MEVNYLITIYEVDRGTEVNCVSTMKRVNCYENAQEFLVKEGFSVSRCM